MAQAPVKVGYKAPPTIARAMRSDDYVRVIVGPVGSGKSSGCVIELLRRAAQQAPGPDGKRKSRWVVIRNCYDAQTEILTEHRGWQLFADLTPDDRVASLHGDKVVWETPTLRYAAPYIGSMVGLRSQTMDLLVTPEHHLWASERTTRQKVWGEFKHVTAESIEGAGETWRMRATAEFPFKAEDERSEAFFEFLGFWFAEGYAATYPRKDTSGVHRRLVVTQNLDLYVDKLLTDAGFEYGVCRKGTGEGANYTISPKSPRVKDLIDELKQYGHATDKWLPRYIIEAPRAHAEAFLRGYHKGDGSGGIKSRKTIRPEIYHSMSKRLLDGVHEMLVRLGRAAALRQNSSNKMWSLTALCAKRESPNIRKGHWYREQYKGMVYCVEVSTHVVLVRRNGVALWCGQTYSELRDTTRKTFEMWIPSSLGRWRERDFTFELRTGDIEADILFRALDRPEDVKKLLSLELTGAYLNEVRELPKGVLDVLQTRVSRYPSRLQGGCTWSGIWADTNPWHSTHWAAKIFKDPPEGWSIYRQPGGRSPDAENTENLDPKYYERLIAGKDSEWLKVYVDGQDASSDQGSIYGPLLDNLDNQGGIIPFEHPSDGVYTSWDLGISDATAIWFWRVGPSGVDIIDHYEATGQPLSHFMDVVDARGPRSVWGKGDKPEGPQGKPYSYRQHWLPHDAKARTLVTGSSVLEQASSRWPNKVQVVPGLSLLDGIQAARWLLEQKIRFHSRCHEGLEALRAYHYAWDETSKSFSKTPVHDFSSHSSDSFRYLATIARNITQRETVKPEPKPFEGKTLDKHFTLDALFAEYERAKAKERI